MNHYEFLNKIPNKFKNHITEVKETKNIPGILREKSENFQTRKIFYNFNFRSFSDFTS